MTGTMVSSYLPRWHALQSALMSPAYEETTGEPIYITTNLKVRPEIKQSDGKPDGNPEIRCVLFVGCPTGNLMDAEIEHVQRVVKEIRDDEGDDRLHGLMMEINNGGIEIKDIMLD